MTAPASQLLFHHTRLLADSPYGVVEGRPWVRPAEERPPQMAADADFLVMEELAQGWLAEHIGYWPLHVGLGPPVRHWAGYEAQFAPGPAGGPIPWRVMFSFRAPPPALLFHTQELWSIHLASLTQDETGAMEVPALSETQRARVFRRDWDQARWLECGREDPESVCAVCPRLDLRSADRVLCPSEQATQVLLDRGFAEERLRVLGPSSSR